MKIRKAIIAAAGYGTRFLPATKNQPKEMLPLIDKPIIQYLVEEAVTSGISEVIIVTRAGQHALEDHFDSSFELEYMLEKNGKEEALEKVKEIPRLANFIYVRQTKDYPYGNATPLLVAEPLINENEGFVYMFGDDLVKGRVPAVKQMIRVFQKHKPIAMLAVQEVPWSEVQRYGAVAYKKGTKIHQIDSIIEKPGRNEAPSNMVQFGRFVLTKRVIEEVKSMPTGKGGELWLTDAMNRLAKKCVVIAQPIEGEWLTTGDPLRYLKATIEYALEREDIGKQLRHYLKRLKTT